MEQDEGNTGVPAGEDPRRDLRTSLRSVAHDINGALNNLALNLELLDRSTVQGSAAPEGARERYLASLRRAVDSIGQIVNQRLMPLASSDSDGKGPQS